jgi:hypothetical protein
MNRRHRRGEALCHRHLLPLSVLLSPFSFSRCTRRTTRTLPQRPGARNRGRNPLPGECLVSRLPLFGARPLRCPTASHDPLVSFAPFFSSSRSKPRHEWCTVARERLLRRASGEVSPCATHLRPLHRRASPADHPGRPIASGRRRLVRGVPIWSVHGGPVDRGPRRGPRLCQPPDPRWIAWIGPTPLSTSRRCNLACSSTLPLNL